MLVTCFEQNLHWTRTTRTPAFCMRYPRRLMITWYRCWLDLKGPVCAFTLVFFRKFRVIFVLIFNLTSTTCVLRETIFLRNTWSLGSHPFVLASPVLAIHLPGPKGPQECSYNRDAGDMRRHRAHYGVTIVYNLHRRHLEPQKFRTYRTI